MHDSWGEKQNPFTYFSLRDFLILPSKTSVNWSGVRDFLLGATFSPILEATCHKKHQTLRSLSGRVITWEEILSKELKCSPNLLTEFFLIFLADCGFCETGGVHCTNTHAAGRAMRGSRAGVWTLNRRLCEQMWGVLCAFFSYWSQKLLSVYIFLCLWFWLLWNFITKLCSKGTQIELKWIQVKNEILIFL